VPLRSEIEWKKRSVVRNRNRSLRDQRPDPSESGSASAVYCGFLEAQLAEQDARKASFEQRGLSVVTTSGALATLLFGVAAFAKTGKLHALPVDMHAWLLAALIAFVAAGLLALLTNLPIAYNVPKLESVLRVAQKPESEADARLELAAIYVGMATDAKRKNRIKGWLLFAALLCELAAILAVAVAVFYVVR
jgi:hypothetical protein